MLHSPLLIVTAIRYRKYIRSVTSQILQNLDDAAFFGPSVYNSGPWENILTKAMRFGNSFELWYNFAKLYRLSRYVECRIVRYIFDTYRKTKSRQSTVKIPGIIFGIFDYF